MLATALLLAAGTQLSSAVWCGAQPAVAAAATQQPQTYGPGDGAGDGGSGDDDNDPATFYARWPYAGPLDILPYVRAHAARGDAEAVLKAIDDFSARYPMYKIGPEKGGALEAVVRAAAPQLALELGTFIGYSAVRTARNLPAGGRLVCVEANPEAAQTARAVVEHAGLAERVEVVQGLSSAVLPGLAERLGHAAAGLVFLDHCKDCYLPDLRALEKLGLVVRGSWVLADNVVYPGAPGFMEYLQGRDSPKDAEGEATAAATSGSRMSSPFGAAGQSTSRGGRGGMVAGSSGGAGTADGAYMYRTGLIGARYEYDQVWKEGWEPKEDGMAVAVCLREADSQDGGGGGAAAVGKEDAVLGQRLEALCSDLSRCSVLQLRGRVA